MPFNVASPRQVAEVLFERLKLPRGKRTKDGYSTDVEVLEALAVVHPLPKLLLAHRQIQKLKSGYVDSLPRLTHKDTGRLHATFHQTVASTGRLSASDPNLQNIPIRTEGSDSPRLRRRGSADSRVLDYSQIEPAFAHFARSRADGPSDGRGRAPDTANSSACPRSGPPPSAQAGRQFGILYGMGPVAGAGLSPRVRSRRRFIEEYKRTLAGSHSTSNRPSPGAAHGVRGDVPQARRPFPICAARVPAPKPSGPRSTCVRARPRLIKIAMVGSTRLTERRCHRAHLTSDGQLRRDERGGDGRDRSLDPSGDGARHPARVPLVVQRAGQQTDAHP